MLLAAQVLARAASLWAHACLGTLHGLRLTQYLHQMLTYTESIFLRCFMLVQLVRKFSSARTYSETYNPAEDTF